MTPPWRLRRLWRMARASGPEQMWPRPSTRLSFPNRPGAASTAKTPHKAGSTWEGGRQSQTVRHGLRGWAVAALDPPPSRRRWRPAQLHSMRHSTVVRSCRSPQVPCHSRTGKQQSPTKHQEQSLRVSCAGLVASHRFVVNCLAHQLLLVCQAKGRGVFAPRPSWIKARDALLRVRTWAFPPPWPWWADGC